VNRRSFVTVLATASILLAGLGAGPLPRSAAQEVASRVRQCDEAWARSDVATLDRLLADRYVHADALGRVQRRADWLADAGKPRNVAIALDGLAVRVQGRVAVVTGSNRITTPERDLALRFTEVWVKAGSAWLRTASRAEPAAGGPASAPDPDRAPSSSPGS
jgi:Domain of unknown function (DUF4440)